MTYRNILVHIDGQPACARRIAVAARLAGKLGARVTGIAIVPPLELPQALRSHAGAKKILGEQFEKSRKAARALAADFVKQALAAGAPRAEAKIAEDEPLRALERAANSCDLIVLGQPDPDDLGALGGHLVEDAILRVSRPALVVPAAGEIGDIGRRVLVAWKDAAASARAIADARPLLEAADKVTVLGVSEDASGSSEADGAAYLADHGIKAVTLAVQSEDAGKAILSQAKKSKADLIVMGAFARPRFTEMVMGGATRTVLQNMGSPVLMSH